MGPSLRKPQVFFPPIFFSQDFPRSRETQAQRQCPSCPVPPTTHCPSLLQAFYLEPYVLEQVEVLGVRADILREPGMVCVFGEAVQEGEVGITHRVFTGAGEDSAVDAGSAFLCLLLEQEQHGCVPLGGHVPCTNSSRYHHRHLVPPTLLLAGWNQRATAKPSSAINKEPIASLLHIQKASGGRGDTTPLMSMDT